MIKNYLKVAFRNLWKNKLYTIINILGLSIAIACSIVAYLNYDLQTSFDIFHKNADKIYRVLGVRTINQNNFRFGVVPLPLGERLKQDLPSIEKVTSLEWASAIVRYQDRIFNEGIMFTDENFFQMFTFPMKIGIADMTNKSSIVISEEYATKYFGNEQPIGKILTITFTNGVVHELTVTGVVNKYPENSSVDFNMAASSEILTDVGLNKSQDWADWVNALFIEVTNPNAIPTINDQLKKYLPIQIAANQKVPLSGFMIEPLKDVALNGRDTRSNGLNRPYPPSQIYGVAVIAGLVLLMACFNFINTSLAFSSKRLKEIGVRKVIGGMRRQLLIQFLGENILLCIISMILALGLAQIFVPAFNDFFQYIHLVLNYKDNWKLILFLFSLLIITGVGAGLYPAFVISSYNPIGILKGSQKMGNISIFMRVLLTLQFSLTMISIITSIIFAQNAEYNRNFDMGFEKELVVVVPIMNEQTFTIYKNEIRNNSNIVNISGSGNHIVYSGSRRAVKHLNTEREAGIYWVGFNYIETMKLRLKNGRSFDENISSDLEESVIVNERFVKEMGLDNAIGKIITVEDKRYSVIGVVEDFYANGPWEPIIPAVIRGTTPDKYTFMQVSVQAEKTKQTFDYLKATWSRLFPDKPFDGYYQHPGLAEAIQVSEGVNRMSNSVSIIDISISAMGLFALVSLIVARRTKEIGIRKALGASVSNIISLVNKQFVSLLFISIIIADISGYVLLQFLLDNIYAYHTNVGVIALIGANILVFIVSVLTVGSQVWKAAKANPVDSLKYE